VRENIFVDTSAWLALAKKRDRWHKKTKKIRDELLKQNCTFWISEYIVIKIANALSKLNLRQSAINLIDSIFRSNEMRFVWINREFLMKVGIFTKKDSIRNGA